MEKHYILGHHLVGFLDVLGQREKFRQLEIPKTPEDHTRVGRVLRETAGFVSDLRDTFQSNFKAFESGISIGPLGMLGSVQPKFVGFSDSFVVSVALRNDRGDLIPIISVFAALSAAATVMLTSLASQHALRGGMDVGLATEIGAGEIYGTALERAYLLECQSAQYPRIVIGDELWKYLSVALVRFKTDAAPDARIVEAIVRKITQLISTDTDGKRILDYLGPVFKELMKPGDVNIMVQPAYDFVAAEQQRFSSIADEKLGKRYALLRRYFESRLPQFGLACRPWP
ncbi:MAG: hypothetical protein WA581_19430 [Candidatus Acidiferrales bacterium]